MNAFLKMLAVILAQAGLTLGAEDDFGGRPEWIDLAAQARLPLYCEAVQSELWATREEARSDALRQASTRALDFVAEAVPRVKSAWLVPTWLVQDHLLREPIYVEEVDWTYGPMYRAHLLLDLSPDKRKLLLSKWHEALVRRRLGQIGGVLGFVLVTLATLVGYLRLDDATRGYYSRWLMTGAIVVVAGSAAVLYTLVG